ncbi:RHBDD1 [Lepeophtheirus salmonis]|uniref:RHBDD1 n=1 Tax=Lepeophtheirus salmonis TaxID=72036 RepID=A0A7R8CC51_LEPSM|nr:RHBDD1 [Lepeophtheirus salmonis]CAF2767611.1 RHBDD1 [Lepeophtheirus salmonis]
MTPYGMSRRSGVGGGIILLLYEVFGVYGIESIPKLMIPVPLSPISVVEGHFSSILLGPLFHADDIHLYYNMANFIWKGRKLERIYGSINFALLLLVLTIGSSLSFVGLSYLAADFLQDPSFIRTRAIGFSGVLFALKVIVARDNPLTIGMWAELVITQLAVPNASFLGHLSGVLFGLCFVLNPFTSFVQSVQKSISKYHILATRNWTYFLSAPLTYKDQIDYLILFISFPIKLSLIESYRGVTKAWISFVIALIGTSVTYYLSCCYLRLERLPFLREECVYGLSGALFALKAVSLCVMLFEGIDFKTLYFELIEAYFILLNESYNLYHLCGVSVGILLFFFLKSQRRYAFRGRGSRLGGSNSQDIPTNTQHIRSNHYATRSWGYGDYDRDSVVRRRVKRQVFTANNGEEEIAPKIINESLQSYFEEEAQRIRRSESPSPSAPPEPSYPSLVNPPPPPTTCDFETTMPSAPPEEDVMDIDYISDNDIDDIRQKRIHKFG